MKELANSRLFMLKYWKWMFVLFVAVLSSCKTTQQPVKQSLVLGENPKREFRGAWIQTAFQGEYKEMSVKEMRRSFIPISRLRLQRLERSKPLLSTIGAQYAGLTAGFITDLILRALKFMTVSAAATALLRDLFTV